MVFYGTRYTAEACCINFLNGEDASSVFGDILSLLTYIWNKPSVME